MGEPLGDLTKVKGIQPSLLIQEMHDSVQIALIFFGVGHNYM